MFEEMFGGGDGGGPFGHHGVGQDGDGFEEHPFFHGAGMRGFGLRRGHGEDADAGAGLMFMDEDDMVGGFGGTKRWHGQRNSPGVSANPADNIFDPSRGPLKAYLGPAGLIKQCPSFTDPVRDGSRNAFEAGTGGYAYNQSYIGGRNDLYGFPTSGNPAASLNSAGMDAVTNPVQTVMFTDAALQQAAGAYLIEYSFAEPPFVQINPGPASTTPTIPSIHFRHHESTNVAWSDGHIDARRLSFTHFCHSLASDSSKPSRSSGAMSFHLSSCPFL